MAVTGYDPNISFYATRYSQGGRRVYSLDLSLTQIASLLPAPDPANPTEGNRRVKETHARAFGEYVRTKTDWVAPALVLRAPDIFQFELTEEIGGTQFGVLSFPRLASLDLRILDGQHRILGIHMAIQAIADEIERSRTLLAAAKRNGDPAGVISQLQHKVTGLMDQRKRFDSDRTSLQIFIEDDQVAFKQMFFDIADNALGITSSVRSRFDNRKVVNRALEDVMKHALLKNRVDPEQDRIGRNNPNLLGAKHVSEIIRTVAVGIDGRVSKRLEDSLQENELVERTDRFLDVLLEAFPPLAQVADDEITPEDLRKSSMLGSTTMMRILAGVYGELADRQRMDDEDITDFFILLAPHMNGAVRKGDIWDSKIPDDVFQVGSLAPRSRRQDLKVVKDSLVEWAINKPEWLSETAA